MCLSVCEAMEFVWEPRLYHSDCLYILPTIPDASVDLIYCDPPFGVLDKEWDKKLSWKRVWPELWRILKPNGNIVLHASASFAKSLVVDESDNLRHHWLWMKWTGNINSDTKLPMFQYTNVYNAKRMPIRCTEFVYVFNKFPQNATYNPTMAFGHTGTTPNELLYFTPRAGDFTRPIELAEYLVKVYSNEGDVVLDFCMSDGQTGMACKNLKRHFIGIDVNKDHFYLALDRLSGRHEPVTSVMWSEARNSYIIQWRNNSVKQEAVVAVTETRDREQALAQALQLKEEVDSNKVKTLQQYKDATARSNGKLGIPGIYHKWLKRQKTLYVATSPTDPVTKSRKEVVFPLYPGCYQAAIEEAIQHRMNILGKRERPNYDIDFAVKRLKEIEEMLRNE